MGTRISSLLLPKWLRALSQSEMPINHSNRWEYCPEMLSSWTTTRWSECFDIQIYILISVWWYVTFALKLNGDLECHAFSGFMIYLIFRGKRLFCSEMYLLIERNSFRCFLQCLVTWLWTVQRSCIFTLFRIQTPLACVHQSADLPTNISTWRLLPSSISG